MATAPRPGSRGRHARAAYVLFWKEAVDLQGARAREGQVGVTQSQIEMYWFVIGLRQLLRAVRLCVNYDRSSIDKAMHSFEQALPGTVDARDMIEHFDDYEEGAGKLQNPKGGGPTPIGPYGPMEWFWNDGTTAGITLGPYRIDVRTALAAADDLADAALRVLHESIAQPAPAPPAAKHRAPP